MTLWPLHLLFGQLACQRGQHVLHLNVLVQRGADAHAVMHDVGALQPVNVGGEGARAEVGEYRADTENAVAAFDKGADLLVHQLSVVHADVLRVGFVECALVAAKGRPEASTTAMASAPRPQRGIRMPGRMQALLAA